VTPQQQQQQQQQGQMWAPGSCQGQHMVERQVQVQGMLL
jgi:hypothetical protein